MHGPLDQFPKTPRIVESASSSIETIKTIEFFKTIETIETIEMFKTIETIL